MMVVVEGWDEEGSAPRHLLQAVEVTILLQTRTKETSAPIGARK